MYLKRLELAGFKSFAQKTVLDFPAGIAVIVGPNGSGKSNIIDAIRWLLGEREAKNIRGLKAEDLIFAGTPQKPRLGLAQVGIIFDNSNNFFPIDYKEISIKRRIARDGISQYFLNDAEVRLKDIVDFFAKSRLGTKGFTIVNQGDSDIFVRATPQERRTMMEEILGLRQYQLKKHEAKRKLENTQFNLEKTDVMIEELAPHLRLLRRQAAKWQKQEDIDKELKDLERQYFGTKLKIIKNDFSELNPKITNLEKEIEGKKKEFKKFQTDLIEVEKSAPQRDSRFEEFRKKQNELFAKKSILQKELGRLEAQIEFLLSHPKTDIQAADAVKLLSDLRKNIKDILGQTEINHIRRGLKELIEKINHLLDSGGQDRDSRLQELEKSKIRISSELSEIDKKFEELTDLEARLNAELKNFNEVFKKAFELVEAKKDEVANLENRRTQLMFDRERIEIRRQELVNLAFQIGRQLGEFEDTVLGEMGEPEINFPEAEKRMFKLRAELAGIGELDPALIKEAQETEARHNFLSVQIKDLKKASGDLEILIRDLDKKIRDEFNKSLHEINQQLNYYSRLMFGGGHARLKIQKPEVKVLEVSEEAKEEEAKEEDGKQIIDQGGIEIDISIPKKKISGLDMLSGGERSLVSIAALFALISVSPPPFLVLDEIDAALDERNAGRFAELISEFSKKIQFLLVSHNRATIEAGDILYGVTMIEDGTSKVLSLRLDEVKTA